MIGMWSALVRMMRRGRIVLLPVLVFLVSVHLAGAAHSATFSGPHTTLAVDGLRRHAPQESAPPAFTGEPPHEHDTQGHIDHAVDRPRSAETSVVAVPVTAALLAAPSGQSFASGVSAGSTTCAAGPPGDAALALNCVWRQ
ncbi:hypothetical protein ACFWC9_29260 [Streptomyces goshikiensis]|uniref:hypothetical protein n=1 Tax=Streptomyces goshikiensis TaxID=1942 RepID=UPI0036A1B8FD